MKVRSVLVMLGVLVGFLSMPQSRQASAAQPGACPDPSNCAQVSVGVVGSNPVAPGGTTTVKLSFAQGPVSGQAGGIDKIAALAFTLGMPGSAGNPPLMLADCGFSCVGGSNAGNACSTDSDCAGGQCQVNAVKGAIANFKVVVENASCANGRTHCLCPPQGGTPDDFINVAVYGPNPLPTPGPSGIEIPTLPAGGLQQLCTIDLAASASASGQIPLHIINQVQDATHPQFTAFLSVGDKVAVDQTCVPAPGSPPCSATNSVSQVATSDSSVTVSGGCCGDSGRDGAISTGEATNAVLALVNRDVSKNPAADCNSDGAVSTGEATKVILNLVNRTCNS